MAYASPSVHLSRRPLQVFLKDPTEENFLLFNVSRKEKIFLWAVIVANFLSLPFIYLFSPINEDQLSMEEAGKPITFREG